MKARMVKIAGVYFLVAGAMVCGVWAGPVSEPVRGLMEIQGKAQKVLPVARAATVGIIAGDGTGSGVVVSEDGLVLTAGHVSGRPGQEITVVFEDGREVKATSLGRSALSDAGMARIKEEGKWPAAEILGEEGAVDVGDWVFALGHPGGFDGARGTVFRYGRVIRARGDTVQTDCKLQGGDSGGPLFDLEGKVIGIHSRIWRPVDQNFHVALNAFRSDWDEMLAGEVVLGPGGIGGGFLGAGTVDEDGGGVMVEQIIPGSAAEEYGLELGDVIAKIGEKEIRDTADFSKVVAAKEAGEEIEIEVVRDGERVILPVTLGRRPGS